MNVSLPEDLKDFVDECVAEGSYGTASEYVRELIRRDRARVRLRTMILEGLTSPAVGVADPAYWSAKRSRYQRGARSK